MCQTESGPSALPHERESGFQEIFLSWKLDFHVIFLVLYYYMRSFCNLIGLEQWYFSLI